MCVCVCVQLYVGDEKGALYTTTTASRSVELPDIFKALALANDTTKVCWKQHHFGQGLRRVSGARTPSHLVLSLFFFSLSLSSFMVPLQSQHQWR